MSSDIATVLMADKLPYLGARAELLAGLGVRHCYFLLSFNLLPYVQESSDMLWQFRVRLADGYGFP